MRRCGRTCSGRWNDCARCLRLRANGRSKTATANFQRKKKSFCETASERRRADFTTEAPEEGHRERGDFKKGGASSAPAKQKENRRRLFLARLLAFQHQGQRIGAGGHFKFVSGHVL